MTSSRWSPGPGRPRLDRTRAAQRAHRIRSHPRPLRHGACAGESEAAVDGTTKWRRRAGTAGLVAAGAVAAAVVASTLTAGADEGGGSGSPASLAAADQDRGQRPDEQLLTGGTKDRVEAAVLAGYPGATIRRTETDSGGVYESHIVSADGRALIVLVGEAFAVTGTQRDRHGG